MNKQLTLLSFASLLAVFMECCQAFTQQSRLRSISWLSSTQNKKENASLLLSSCTRNRPINLKRIGQSIIHDRTTHNSRSGFLSSSSMMGPNHIAFICDGNSRWASLSSNQQQNRGEFEQSTFWGHSQGGSRCTSLIKYLVANRPDVKYVTMYGFSSENWSRSPNEIRDIWRVMEQTASSFYNLAIENEIRVKILGEMDDNRIPNSLRNILHKIEVDTSTSNKKGESKEREPFTLCLAINYGGRNDITNATRKIAELVARGEMSPEDVNVDTLSSLLSTSGIPDPDLVIRTGGEKRISNFLIWDCAYSEFYFTDVLWPDFDEEELDLAVSWYRNRDRRFGGRHTEGSVN